MIFIKTRIILYMSKLIQTIATHFYISYYIDKRKSQRWRNFFVRNVYNFFKNITGYFILFYFVIYAKYMKKENFWF